MALPTSVFVDRARGLLGGRGWMRRLARGVGRDYATIKRWAAGDLPVPDYVEALLECLAEIPMERYPDRFQPKQRRKKRVGPDVLQLDRVRA